jgi:hypothetical protein
MWHLQSLIALSPVRARANIFSTPTLIAVLSAHGVQSTSSTPTCEYQQASWV